jgi:hypothetical protein
MYVCVNRQQRNSSALSGKHTMTQLSNAAKEKIVAVLSSLTHSDSSTSRPNDSTTTTASASAFALPGTISALVGSK